ncbi:hypothetical protein PGTUg99_013831 [Puccinia graminis f. sp. tritici]|uniref:Uncharacterized protein n=1 Tax=Puccinia graminis f. sp. tritici TaxID=56615 RepID=A0A5B0R5I0_PUCGR|nr:hypothetical protein PGTUg99_013831 [Puccinia graminis f. sp. tritici]
MLSTEDALFDGATVPSSPGAAGAPGSRVGPSGVLPGYANMTTGSGGRHAERWGLEAPPWPHDGWHLVLAPAHTKRASEGRRRQRTERLALPGAPGPGTPGHPAG